VVQSADDFFDPSTIWDTVLLVTFEFGGNFQLYGIVGRSSAFASAENQRDGLG
jgi:hypothetical protein